MELEIKEQTKNRLVLKIHGADHTICNILKQELAEQKGVVAATYTIDHPLVGVPLFVLETEGNLAPKSAIQTALDALAAKNKQFLSAYKKAF